MKTPKVFTFMLLTIFFFTNCKKEYSFEGSTTTTAVARYSLVGSPNTCSNIKLSGGYVEGSILSSSNTITLMIDVSSIGTYTIKTSTINGIHFESSGNFTTTGLQQVMMQGSGTPISQGLMTIPVTAGSSNCSFDIDIAPATIPPPADINLSDFAWQFTQGNKTYHGYFDGALTNLINGSTVLTLVGLTATKDTAIAILVDITGSAIVKPGSYHSTTSSTFSFFDNLGNTIFSADKTTPTADLLIVISTYDTVTKILSGTFSGTALNHQSQPVNITGGKFTARLQ